MSEVPDSARGDAPRRALANRLGLVFCGLAVVAAIAAWQQTGAWYHLLSAAGFACVAFVVRRMPLSLSSKVWPPSKEGPAISRAEAVVQWVGWGLIVAALSAHWLG